jgi:hypothetical protein
MVLFPGGTNLKRDVRPFSGELHSKCKAKITPYFYCSEMIRFNFLTGLGSGVSVTKIAHAMGVFPGLAGIGALWICGPSLSQKNRSTQV